MESKKTFGEYIRERRRAMGLTQREFAEKLYVTESAVSKWERGMSYPDVTLLRDICAVLGVTEHELLTASEDTERRSADRLAAKYLRLTRNYRAALYILFGAVLLGCAIGNLAAQGTLSWFWIVLAAVGLAASPTLVPALAIMNPKTEGVKWHLAAASFLVWLELLLLICCLYSGGDWFPMAGMSVLFGLSLTVLPFMLPLMPLPAWMAERKTSVYLITSTVCLILLLLTCAVTAGETWFPVAAAGVIFGLSFFILPVLLKQLPLPEWMRGRRLSAYLIAETGLLLVLLFVCCASAGEDWFLMTAISVLFGVGLFILPVILRQGLRTPPLNRHKALLYFTAESVLLLLMLFIESVYSGSETFLTVSLPTALLCLLLFWGILGAARYLPVNLWFRLSACSAWVGLWIWTAPFLFDRIMSEYYGENIRPYSLAIPFDFGAWDTEHTPFNVIMLILIALGVLAAAFACIGVVVRKKN